MGLFGSKKLHKLFVNYLKENNVNYTISNVDASGYISVGFNINFSSVNKYVPFKLVVNETNKIAGIVSEIQQFDEAKEGYIALAANTFNVSADFFKLYITSADRIAMLEYYWQADEDSFIEVVKVLIDVIFKYEDFLANLLEF